MKRLIIGCGYLGRRVAAEWQRRGDAVSVLTRSPQHAAEFAALGLQPYLGDVLQPDSLSTLPAAETVLCAVGYDRSAGPAKREVYVDGLRNVLEALGDGIGRLIYISSTSVYGQSRGEWVDEQSPCAPNSDGGRICLSAEAVARDCSSCREGVTILRLSGLYGPGRLAARVDAIESQRPLEGNPDGWINLIHVDDARDTVLACAELPVPVETLLVSDDQPLLRREYYQRLASAIGAPQPIFEEDVSTTLLGKRCSNQKLRQALSLDLVYPTIAEGLPTAL